LHRSPVQTQTHGQQARAAILKPWNIFKDRKIGEFEGTKLKMVQDGFSDHGFFWKFEPNIYLLFLKLRQGAFEHDDGSKLVGPICNGQQR
jgi:hypothetical protein